MATVDPCAAGLIVSHNGNGAGKKFSILSAASAAVATLSMVAVDIGIPASDALCSGLTTQTHLNHSLILWWFWYFCWDEPSMFCLLASYVTLGKHHGTNLVWFNSDTQHKLEEEMLKTIKFTLTLGAMVVAGQTAFAATECHDSKWGKDDLIGSANLISPENTLKAAALIKRGKSQPLGIVIDSKTPAFAPRSLSLQVVRPNQQGGQKLDAFGYPGNYNDDILYTWVGIGSQIDGLGHLGEGGL